MEKVVEFLKEAGTYYLATVEGDQPRVRPFGTCLLYTSTADGDTIYTVADTVVSTVSGLTLYDYVKINQLPTVTADQIENITVDAGDKTYVMDAEDSVTSDSTSSGDEINASDTSSTAGTDETAESENTKSEKSNSEIWSSLTQALAGRCV